MTKRTGGKIGRPKKDSDIASLKDILLQMATKKDKNGRSYHEAVCRKLLKCAAEEGQSWAIREYLDRVLGKSIQLSQTDLTTAGQSLNATVNFVDSSKVLNAPSEDIPLNDNRSNDNPCEDKRIEDSRCEDNPSEENVESEGSQPLEKNEECKRDTD